VICERLAAYERQTRPVLDYYRSVGRPVIEVDASEDTPDRVFERIRRAMETNDCSKDRR
jgi:adenylate kinase family enzyme